MAVVRMLTPDDAGAMADLYERMSSLSRYRRYLSVWPSLPADRLAALVNVDGDRHVALGAFDSGSLVAVARYVRLRHEWRHAEIAVEVADDWHRRGLASSLLRQLSDIAKARGVEAFTATMSRENPPVLRLLRSMFSQVQLSYDGPLAEALIPLDGLETAEAA